MNTLPLKFELNADKTGTQTFTQVKRVGDVAMYRRDRKDGTVFGYEVFKVKSRMAGQPLPGGNFEKEDRECYPGSSAFGRTAWSMNNEGLAFIYFNNLVKFGRIKPAKTKDSKLVQKKVGKRGRVTKHTAEIVPLSGNFTLDDLVSEYKEPRATLYLKLRKLIESGKVREVEGVTEKLKRGRAKKVYCKV